MCICVCVFLDHEVVLGFMTWLVAAYTMQGILSMELEAPTEASTTVKDSYISPTPLGIRTTGTYILKPICSVILFISFPSPNFREKAGGAKAKTVRHGQVWHL